MPTQKQPEFTKPFGQLWPPVANEGRQEEYESREAVGIVDPGESVIIYALMPSNRLYGTLVSIENITNPAAQIEVTMWGSESGGALDKQQYAGTAKAENGFADTFQQWRYRDFDGGRLLRLKLKNVGAVQASFTAVIQGEPF